MYSEHRNMCLELFLTPFESCLIGLFSYRCILVHNYTGGNVDSVLMYTLGVGGWGYSHIIIILRDKE